MSRIRDLFLKYVYPEAFKVVDSQYPLPTDGDSIYIKDIDVSNSSIGGFSGAVTDFFDSLKSVNNDASTDNPKSIKVWFNRTIQTHAIAFGCDDLTKSFSNIVVKVLGSGEEIRYTVDQSTDSTKRNSYAIEMPHLFLNGFIVEFHTADEVGLSNVYMAKSTDVHSTISAEQPDGSIIDLTATASGNLKTTDAESGLAIAKGEVTGSSFIHKFGAAPDFDIADGFVTVWDGAEDGEPYESMVYTYSTTADIDSVSAEDAGDTQDIEVQGLDANYALVVQTVTLNGQTRVALTTSLIRVFRVKNVSSVDFAGHVFCFVNDTLTGGVPDTPANVRAVVHSDNNQTEMAIFTVPAGFTGYMRDWYASTAGAKKASSHTIRVLARPFGQVFQLKHTGNIDVSGTSYIKHDYSEPEVFTEKTDIEIRMNTDQDSAGVAAGFDIVLVED